MCWSSVLLRGPHRERWQTRCVCVCTCVCLENIAMEWLQQSTTHHQSASSCQLSTSRLHFCQQICKCQIVMTRGSVKNTKPFAGCFAFVVVSVTNGEKKIHSYLWLSKGEGSTSRSAPRQPQIRQLKNKQTCWDHAAECHRGRGDCAPVMRPSSLNLHSVSGVKSGVYKVTAATIRSGVRTELYHKAGKKG